MAAKKRKSAAKKKAGAGRAAGKPRPKKTGKAKSAAGKRSSEEGVVYSDVLHQMKSRILKHLR